MDALGLYVNGHVTSAQKHRTLHISLGRVCITLICMVRNNGVTCYVCVRVCGQVFVFIGALPCPYSHSVSLAPTRCVCMYACMCICV